MASQETVVRQRLEEWIAELTLGLAVEVRTESPEGTDVEVYPSAALWFDATDSRPKQPELIQVTGDDENAVGFYLCGDITANVSAIIVCNDKEQSETLRESFRNQFALNAINNTENGHMVRWMDVTFNTIPCKVQMAWTGEDTLYRPDETFFYDLWVLKYSLRVIFPWIVQETTGTGIMNVEPGFETQKPNEATILISSFDLDNWHLSGDL